MTGIFDRGLDLGDGIPVGVAAVTLLLRAPVDGDQRAAVLFHDAGDQFISAVVVPTQADLARHRHVQQVGEALENTGDLQGSPHQAHAGAVVGDRPRRAAHVDVEDVRALLHDAQSGGDDQLGVVPVDLDDERALHFIISETF